VRKIAILVLALTSAIPSLLPSLAHAQRPQMQVPTLAANANATAYPAPQQATNQEPPLPPGMPPAIQPLSLSAPLLPKEQKAAAIAKKWQDGQSYPQPGEDGVVRYQFGTAMPTVVCAPMQVCDIQLQPGEVVNSLHPGDMAQWKVTPAISGNTAGTVTLWTQIVLTLSYAQLGRRTDVAAAVTELLGRFPDFSFERAGSELGAPIKHEPTLALYLDGVRKAGLNECATQAELQKYPKMTHMALCDTRRATN
jgi:hypothetical protein